jgi:hypothetical protein
MKSRILLTLVIYCLFNGSCQEELKRDYPIVKTLVPTQLSALGATFSATIEHAAGQSVIDHGFVWNYGDGDLTINLGPTSGTAFQYKVGSGLPVGNVYVKGFLKTKELTVYGEVIMFAAVGSEGPIVTSFSPTTAKATDTITVIGRNFVSSAMVIGIATNDFVTITTSTLQGGTMTKFVIPISLTGTQLLFLRVGQQKASFPGALTIKMPWEQRAAFPGPSRGNAFSFSVNGKGYMGTGTGASGLLADFWEYDQASDQWTQLANFPGGARANASVFVVGDKAYVGLGEAGTLWSDSQSDLWMFDPTDLSWTPKAAYPGGKRWGSLSFGLNNKGYFAGGKNFQGLNTLDFWEYDPQLNLWSQKSSIPEPIVRSRAPHFAFKGSLDYITEFGAHYRYAPGSNVWVYEFSPWELKGEGWVNLTLDDRALILGQETMQITGDIGSLAKIPYLGAIRLGGFGFVINGKGYYGLGRSESGVLLNELWVFDPNEF